MCVGKKSKRQKNLLVFFDVDPGIGLIDDEGVDDARLEGDCSIKLVSASRKVCFPFFLQFFARPSRYFIKLNIVVTM